MPTGKEGEEPENDAEAALAAAVDNGPPQSKAMGKVSTEKTANPFGDATVLQVDSQDSAKRRVGAMK